MSHMPGIMGKMLPIPVKLNTITLPGQQQVLPVLSQPTLPTAMLSPQMFVQGTVPQGGPQPTHMQQMQTAPNSSPLGL